MNPLLDGTVYSKTIDHWTVTWESNGDYRHWCEQRQYDDSQEIIVVMQNPGALKGFGERLSSDLTLRILRDTFSGTNCHPFVINLFDLATPKPEILDMDWDRRDYGTLIYDILDTSRFVGVIYAYGDMVACKQHKTNIDERIALVRQGLKCLPEIRTFNTNKGNPAHPRLWRMMKRVSEISEKLRAFAKTGMQSDSNEPENQSEPIKIELATGSEPIADGARLEDFWKWAYSDCLNNTTRGVLAEFIVGLALKLDFKKPREAWAKYDLVYKGFGIEVKSCSYHQVWAQDRLSSIQFNIPKTKGWDAATNKMDDESKRQANAYVLCLLAEKEREKVNSLDLDQWRFWVLPTSFFDNRKRSQHSIGYNSLIREVGEPVMFNQIKMETEKVLNVNSDDQ